MKHGNKIFIHIPRTGGTTILNEIKKYECDVKRQCEFNHDPLFKLQSLNRWEEDAYIFCVARNPFIRTYSYYNHYIKHNKPCTFDDFLKKIKLKIKSKYTPYYYYPQSFFIYNDDGEITLSKIFKFEEYNDALKEIADVYQIEFKFGHERQTAWHPDDLLKDYTTENKELVRDLFSIDFINFSYDIEGQDIF